MTLIPLGLAVASLLAFTTGHPSTAAVLAGCSLAAALILVITRWLDE